MTAFGNVVLTGASGGLGTALARRLASPGTNMLLLGRDAERLTRAQNNAKASGANVQRVQCALEDTKRLHDTVAEFDARYPVNLFVANAGVKCGNQNGVEAYEDLDRVVSVNLTGTISSVQSVLPQMIQRRSGRIVLVSSLAALSPQPSLLSYSATKAALRAYGVALRRRCRGTGVGVTHVIPGFIDTPMTDRHLGPTPMKVSADQAARQIAAGIRAGRSSVAFPLTLAVLARLEPLMPMALSDRIALRLDASIVPDDESQQDATTLSH